MTVGFVLISTAPSYEHEVYSKLRSVPEITEIYPLFGEYDLIAKIEVETYDSLGKVVLTKVRGVDGVIDTVTLTGVHL